MNEKRLTIFEFDFITHHFMNSRFYRLARTAYVNKRRCVVLQNPKLITEVNIQSNT